LKYVLDTNAISAFMQGDAAVVAAVERRAPGDVAIPAPAAAEIAYGIARLPPSRRRKRLEEAFEAVRSTFSRVSWTEAVTDAFGAIKAALERRGARLEDFDIAIAAHALAANSVLVTANVRQMSRIAGLQVEDWAARD